MRVCVLTTTYPLGQEDSTPSFVASLTERLANRYGLSVHVVAPHAPGASKREVLRGVEVTRFRYAATERAQCLAYGAGIVENLQRSWRARLQVPAFLGSMFKATAQAAASCDLIHAHWLEPGFVALAAKRILAKPLVITIHRFTPSQIVRSLSGTTLGGANRVLFNSNFTMNLAKQQGISFRSDVHYIGVDAARFKTQARPRETRPVTGLPNDALVIVSVARLIKLKGTVYLIKAFKSIIKAVPHARLVIAGKGPELENLRQETAALGLQQVVLFLGAVPYSKLPQLLAESDVFVLPSKRDESGQTESLGVSTIEAMLAGLACVGSNVGGIPEVIQDQLTGFLVPAASPTDIACCVNKLLTNSVLRTRMGQAGRQRAEAMFSLDTYANKTLAMYRELLDEGKRV